MLVPPVMKGTNRACGVILFADRGSVAVALAVPATGGFVSGVCDFDLPFAGEEEDMGAHSFSILWGGGNDD